MSEDKRSARRSDHAIRRRRKRRCKLCQLLTSHLRSPGQNAQMRKLGLEIVDKESSGADVIDVKMRIDNVESARRHVTNEHLSSLCESGHGAIGKTRSGRIWQIDKRESGGGLDHHRREETVVVLIDAATDLCQREAIGSGGVVTGLGSNGQEGALVPGSCEWEAGVKGGETLWRPREGLAEG